MANPKLATTDYVDGEVTKKQEYFADVINNIDTHAREINLTDTNGTVVGQMVVVPTEGIRYINVLTPENETEGANKKYVDDIVGNIDTILGTMANDASISPQAEGGK